MSSNSDNLGCLILVFICLLFGVFGVGPCARTPPKCEHVCSKCGLYLERTDVSETEGSQE